MAADRTPIHSTPIKTQSKLCLAGCTNPYRLFQLSGRKISGKQTVIDRLEDFFSVDLYEKDQPYLFLCTTCFTKINNYHEFRSAASQHAIHILSTLQRFKRQARTPAGASRKKVHVSEDTRDDRSSTDPSDTVLKPKVKAKRKLLPTKPRRRTVAEAIAESVSAATGAGTRQDTSLDSRRPTEECQVEHTYCKPLISAQPGANKEEQQSSAVKLLEVPVTLDGDTTAITGQIRIMCSPGKSILYNKTPDHLSDTNVFAAAVCELKEYCPLLFHVIQAALGDKIPQSSKIATIATIYGMILHCNNNKVSAVQRLFTTAAIKYHADNKVYMTSSFLQFSVHSSLPKFEHVLLERSVSHVKLLSLLNKVHVTLSDKSKDQLLDSFVSHCEEDIIRSISSGADGKINGDNLDLRVNTNDIRMTNKSKDYHFFASDFVLDRVNVMHLPDNAPIGNTDQIGPDYFLPNPEEIKKFRNCLKIFIARKLVHNISGLSWMKSILPEHIPHDHQEEMSKRSSIFILPIMLKNESKYSDCIGIMDGYVEWINRWYAKAGRGSELEHLQVPVGGDQLTRVRLQGAKALREGCHTQQERFEQLEPVVVEMFHTLQDFLEKLCKKFLKLDKGTDKGTLCHLKMVIQRTNVNGKVKVRFKAHEQFVDVVGTSHLLNLAMEKLNMQTINDSPHHPDMPETMKMWHSNKKEEVFNKFMDDIIDSVFIPPLQQQVTSSSKTADISVIIGMNTRKLTLPVEDGWIKVTVHTPGNRFIISVSTGQVRNGVSVTIPGLTTPVTIQEDASMNDDLHNYAVNFLNWYFVILGMQEATREGNLELCNIVLKFMTPLFYSHSSLSKYMTECLDYILKTEVMMTPRKSLKVRAASFVNPTGRRGHHKASDMQKENQVLVLKDLIRGLGANKTEKSIVKISKVAPVVESVVDNLLLMTDTTNFVSRHRKRSETEDILEILSVLKNNNPWKVTPGRDLSGFAGICKSPYTFNLELFKTSVANTLTRLKQGVILQHGDCETED